MLRFFNEYIIIFSIYYFINKKFSKQKAIIKGLKLQIKIPNRIHLV